MIYSALYCSARLVCVPFHYKSMFLDKDKYLIYLVVCTVLQEAVSTGDPEMVQLVLQRRDYIKASTALGGVPELLCKIREVRLSFDPVYLFYVA